MPRCYFLVGSPVVLISNHRDTASRLLSEESFALASVTVGTNFTGVESSWEKKKVAMASQVLRQFPVVAEATPVPSHPVLSTTPDVHSPPIPKASGTKESSGNFGEHGKSDSWLLFIAPFFGVVLLSFG